MPVPNQEYDNCYLFVWYMFELLILPFAIWTFCLEFGSELGIFVISLISNIQIQKKP